MGYQSYYTSVVLHVRLGGRLPVMRVSTVRGGSGGRRGASADPAAGEKKLETIFGKRERFNNFNNHDGNHNNDGNHSRDWASSQAERTRYLNGGAALFLVRSAA